MNRILHITPNFEIDETCLATHPCQHRVRLNGESSTMNSVDIYKYFIENNLPVPDHWGFCADIVEKEKVFKFIELDDLDSIINCISIDNPKFQNQILRHACRHNKLQIAKYLIEEKGIQVNYGILMECCKHPDSVKLFKLCLSKYSGDCLFQPKMVSQNILWDMVCHSNLNLIKYFIGEYGVDLLTDDVLDKSFIVGYFANVENNTVNEYLVEVCIQKNIVLYKSSVALESRSMELFNKLNDHGLIYGLNAAISIIPRITDNTADDAVVYDIALKHLTNNLDRDLNKLSRTQNTDQYRFVLRPYCLEITNLQFTFNLNAVNNICWDFNGTRFNFTKTTCKNFDIFSFIPIEPLQLEYIPYTSTTIIFEFKQSQNRITNINCDVTTIPDRIRDPPHKPYQRKISNTFIVYYKDGAATFISKPRMKRAKNI